MKRVFNLVDNSFAHDIGATAGKPPKGWVWNRSCTNPEIATFYTHERIFEASGDNCYAMLWESKAIIPQVYERAPEVIDRFQYVFTHDKTLLDRFPDKCRFLPGSGLWVGGSYGLGEVRLYPKNKLLSMVSSTKVMCPLHKLRYDIAKALQSVKGVDVFIGGGGRGTPGWVPIIKSLEDYMYSVVIENYVDDLFFTEKILNCFATGVVPIYLGARRIADFFNPEGIITFSSWDELKGIAPTLSLEDYRRRREAIADNYRRCQEYDSIEGYLEHHYSDLLPVHLIDEAVA